LKPTGSVVCLIKPQLVLRKEQVGKGGIVREPERQEDSVEKIRHIFTTEMGKEWVALTQSPISGTDGNVEFLAWLRHLG
ncbi:MAG: SAM-dependent methyltransferase, partial [Verrucomicrobiota bacterium]